MIVYRPVKWERNIDWRFTQWWWENFIYNWVWFYWWIVKARDSHKGLDYAWPNPWDKITCYSWTDWVVHDAWYDSWRGNRVYIRDDTYEYIYAHLDSIDVVNWQLISAKEKIGIIWTTWNSTGIHLHFGMRPIGWDWIDPTSYITNWNEWSTDPTQVIAKECSSTIEDLVNIRDWINYWKLYLDNLIDWVEPDVANYHWEDYQHMEHLDDVDAKFNVPSNWVVKYKFHNIHPELNIVKQQIIFNNAMTYFNARMRPIKFVRTEWEADINIWFARDGDSILPYPFKPWAVAYAFYPGWNRDWEVYINLNWDITTTEYWNKLLKVLTHELWHTFWFKHSENEDSVMYFKNLKDKPIFLPEDEITDIRDKYNLS